MASQGSGEKRLLGQIAATLAGRRSHTFNCPAHRLSCLDKAVSNKMKPSSIFGRENTKRIAAQNLGQTCPSHLPLSTTVPACPGPPRAWLVVASQNHSLPRHARKLRPPLQQPLGHFRSYCCSWTPTRIPRAHLATTWSKLVHGIARRQWSGIDWRLHKVLVQCHFAQPFRSYSRFLA